MANPERNQKTNGNARDVIDLKKAITRSNTIVNTLLQDSQKGIPDPWLPIAIAVNQGAYNHADNSLRESITIGLRTNPHPEARKAILRLWPDGVPVKLRAA